MYSITRPRHAPAGRRVPEPLGGGCSGPDGGLADRIHLELSESRRMLAAVDSRLRSLMRRRSDVTARALADRIPVAEIAKVARMTPTEVRIAGCGYADLHFAGLAKAQHLADVAGIASAMASALDQKTAIERGRRALIVEALRSGQLDAYQIAAVSGLTTEHVRIIARGAAVRSGRVG